ncbi:MAG: hypothetical protein JST11_01415 [Acidobacteria bacterium]|nr:hypothetical protein [Acidobacteriota bacterium]
MNSRRFHPDLILAATAVFAMLWAIARAAVQSITIDEADTYLVWVARNYPSHWEAASNNHVLNSLMMRFTTALFGVSHLSVRAPALFGAALYIAMAWALCRLLAPASAAAWPLFVALVFNPFIFDHLVAARGYALALGFLMAAIALAGYARDRGWPPERVCAIASACLALSVAANFPFAIVDAVTMAAIFAWACARTQAFRARVRLLGASVLPGLLVTVFVSAPAVLHWPKGQLVYGAHSMREWLGEIARDSLWQPNPQIVNPLVMAAVERVAPYLIPGLLALALAAWARERGNGFLRMLLAVAAASVALHWAAFRGFHLLLPKQRTGIWIVPLVTLAIGAAAPRRRVLTAGLYAMAVYFLLCLRLTWFREWNWDADMRQVYAVVAEYSRAHEVARVAGDWMYAPSLNFYRVASGNWRLEEIAGPQRLPGDRDVYVLHAVFDEAFLREQGLHVIYRGASTDAVVAVRPPETAHQRATPRAPFLGDTQ